MTKKKKANFKNCLIIFALIFLCGTLGFMASEYKYKVFENCYIDKVELYKQYIEDDTLYMTIWYPSDTGPYIQTFYFEKENIFLEGVVPGDWLNIRWCKTSNDYKIRGVWKA